MEMIINGAKNWDLHRRLTDVTKFITLDNKTDYKDVEVFLVFRDKASDYIKSYENSHREINHLSNIPVEIIISDLESRYQEIKSEKQDSSFYLKIANYGQYLYDIEPINSVVEHLFHDSEVKVGEYEKAWQEFFEKWQLLAKDLIEKAEKAGIKDEGALQNEIAEMKGRLESSKLAYDDEELSYYYRPYVEVINRFKKADKG